jgi:hypothetical protein
MSDRRSVREEAGVLFGGGSTLGTRRRGSAAAGRPGKGTRGTDGGCRIIARGASRRAFRSAHLVLERVRDLVGRWLPDLNPRTLVITSDISPPVAAGYAADVLFLSAGVNTYIGRCEAAGERNGINASKLMKGLPASPVTDGNGTVTSTGTGERPGTLRNHGPGFDSTT